MPLAGIKIEDVKPPRKAGGFPCPECGAIGCRTIDSRYSTNHGHIRRRKSCRECGHLFTTVEISDQDTALLYAVKRLKPCGEAIAALNDAVNPNDQ